MTSQQIQRWADAYAAELAAAIRGSGPKAGLVEAVRARLPEADVAIRHDPAGGPTQLVITVARCPADLPAVVICRPVEADACAGADAPAIVAAEAR